MKLYDKVMNARDGEHFASFGIRDGKGYLYLPGMIEPIVVVPGLPVTVRCGVPTPLSSDVPLQLIVQRDAHDAAVTEAAAAS